MFARLYIKSSFQPISDYAGKNAENRSEPQFGNEGGRFWAVSICGRKDIWFTNIENGFNISDYNENG